MEQASVLRLRAALGAGHDELGMEVLSLVDSTNGQLKQRARSGQVQAPFLLMARAQSAGRGRLGRAFVSPADSGLYMSLLARPPQGTDPGRITLLAAVAVCRAIEELTSLCPKIKWVNDLFVGGRKVCGILAEGVGEQVVIGIGVNLRTPPGGFPPEAGVAGALDVPLAPEQLAGRIAAHLLDDLADPCHPRIVEAYRARMPLTGQWVVYQQDGIQKSGRVLGVAQDGGLMVEGEDGQRVLRCGEVSLGSQAFRDLL